MTNNLSTVPFELLNRLPINCDPAQWCFAFQNALHVLVPEAARITVHVNMQCVPTDDRPTETVVSLVQHLGEIQARQYPTVLLTANSSESIFRQLHEQFLRVHVPLEQYAPPVHFEYYYRGQLAGYVVLWFTELSDAQISRASAVISKLEHFIVFALSDCIARNRWAPAVNGDSTMTFHRYAEEWRLTEQDRKILMHLLSGASYKEAADRLGISINTVRKHTQKIYRSTGTNGLAELSAKYFINRPGVFAGM